MTNKEYQEQVIQDLKKTISEKNHRINELGEELVMVREELTQKNSEIKELQEHQITSKIISNVANLVGERNRAMDRIKELESRPNLKVETKDLYKLTNEITKLKIELDAAHHNTGHWYDMVSEKMKEITKLNKILDLHRRFHSKSGCPGGDRCYVCRGDDECVGG